MKLFAVPTPVKPNPWLTNLFLRIDRFLGHGRAVETFLAGAKILFGLVMLPHRPDDPTYIVFADLLWWYPNWYIALPFVVVGAAQMFGVVANYYGWAASWRVRALCAMAAEIIWLIIIIRHIQLWITTGLLPFAIMATFFNFWIFWKAMNRLPPPGSVGLAA